MDKNRSNPWNRGGRGGGGSRQPNKASNGNLARQVQVVSGEAKFREAQERMQKSVKKYLENEYESSEEEEELETQPIFDSVLKSYSQLGGEVRDLERTQSHLENTFQSGSALCLICIATVRRADQIWSCLSCFGFFHLNCIQRWAKDSLAQQKLIADDRPSAKTALVFKWLCPKCREEYEPDKIPKKYICFCGQTEDPEYQQWLVPHSCGEKCSKPLKPLCGHTCLLLCHPGPCPPCPKVVESRCFCKSETKKLRCSHKEWSCNKKCTLLLECKKHKCNTQCHQAPCPPCDKTELFSCLCGNKTKRIPCAQLSWQCEKICGKKLSCGLHICERVCHVANECGPCPRSEPRSCPCGKSIQILPCEQDVQTCGGTCDKILDCSLHRCPQRCHNSSCGTCLEIVVKTCRCGLNSKEVSCSKDYLCEVKCKRMRDCNIHPCNRKCCDGNCPPCEKLCNSTLSCGKHKCNSVCHRGPCYPCQLTKPLSCHCGQTTVIIPCVKRKIRPPKCNKLCRIPPDCEHESREKHRCHFDTCPACKQICGKTLECGHVCPAVCHTAVLAISQQSAKPATPCDLVNVCLERKKLPCPPCNVPVEVTCLGQHETIYVPCHGAVPRSCGRPCGRRLDCTNHVCQLPCHVPFDETGEKLCEECERSCELSRPCDHECKRWCHPSPCADCKITMKMQCHCALTNVFVKCFEWQSADQEKRNELLSCGNNCPKLLECGHRCSKNCHSGSCTSILSCKRKTKLTCPCKRIKKDFQCSAVSSGNALVDCDQTCLEIQQEKIKEEEKNREAARIEEERKNKEELEKYEKKLQGGRKRSRKQRNDNNDIEDDSFLHKYRFVLVSLTVVAAAVTAYVCLY